MRLILFVGFPHSSVGLLGLLLKQLQFALEGLVLGTVLDALVGGKLGVLDGGLELLDLLLEDLVAVGQGGDLLLLAQVLLLENLDASLELLNLSGRLVRLGAERGHFLQAGDISITGTGRMGEVDRADLPP